MIAVQQTLLYILSLLKSKAGSCIRCLLWLRLVPFAFCITKQEEIPHDSVNALMQKVITLISVDQFGHNLASTFSAPADVGYGFMIKAKLDFFVRYLLCLV